MRTVKKDRQHELDRNDNASEPAKGTISGFHPATNGLARPATSPKPFSFVDELRPADLELAPTLSTLPPPLPLQRVAPLAPPPLPTITDEPSFESYHSVDAQLEEYLANEEEPAHEADRDDRTVERYVPPSVEDLDYDSDQTTDMPPAWIDHLAASARPSNRPPPADAQPASLVDKTNTSANNAPTLPPPAPVPALPLTSSPSPSAAAFVPPPPPRMLDVLAGVEASALGGSAFTAPPLSLPPTAHASSRSGPPSGQLAIPTPSQPLSIRSNPIPWNPTPPPEPRARKSRGHMPLLLLAGGLVWLVALAVVLRWLLH